MKEHKEISVEKLDKVSGGLRGPSDTRVTERRTNGRGHDRKPSPAVGIYTNW